MRKCTRLHFNDYEGEELEWIRSHVEARSASEADHIWVESLSLEVEKEHNDLRLRKDKKKTNLA